MSMVAHAVQPWQIQANAHFQENDNRPDCPSTSTVKSFPSFEPTFCSCGRCCGSRAQVPFASRCPDPICCERWLLMTHSCTFSKEPPSEDRSRLAGKTSSLPGGPQPISAINGHTERSPSCWKRELFCAASAPEPSLHGLNHSEVLPETTSLLGFPWPCQCQALLLRNPAWLHLSPLSLSCPMTPLEKLLSLVGRLLCCVAALWRLYVIPTCFLCGLFTFKGLVGL